MTGRQIVGVWLFVAIAFLLLRVLPRGSWYHRLMLKHWGVRPHTPYQRLRRRDFLRCAAWVLTLGVGLLILSLGSFAWAERIPLPQRQLWIEAVAFGSFLLACLSFASVLALLGRAALLKAAPPLPFLVLAGGEPIGESDLSPHEPDPRMVAGALLPLPGIDPLAAAIRTFSGSLRRASTPSARRAAARQFTDDHSIRIRSRSSGAEVGAHYVALVDLQALGAGFGLVIELELSDPASWAAVSGATGAP